ncbi:cadherin-like protein 26 [Synchiropus picturatus]
MWTISLLILCCLSAQAESLGRRGGRTKREILSRSKRRWVLSTIEVVEEDRGPFPKKISQMFNNKLERDSTGHSFRIMGMGVTQPPLGVFRIDPHNGTVFALQSIDRELHDNFHIKFDILDEMGNLMDKELAFDVEIKDLNDNAPRFKDPKMTANVKENSKEGDALAVINVEDRDQRNTPNSTVVMRIVRQEPKTPPISLKQINNDMGQLTFTGCFNYDKIKKYEVTVEARDKGTPPLSSTAVITLNIVDANTHPAQFKQRKYSGSVTEGVTKDEVFRVGINDKDEPKTPGWEAEYTIIRGNEMEYYKIVTDPETNEGILGVIKGKDFERTKKHTLEIGVRNKEPLFVCGKTIPRGAPRPFDDIINVTVTVIDANDAPEFNKKLVIVHQKEEEEPGKVLLTPKITDEDSDLDQVRFVLLEDPAKWMTIDKKTGAVKATKKLDRESPFVKEGSYKVLVGAVDNGEPPATGTCTVLVHLMDINDNKPRLASNVVTLCANKGDKVMVAGNDSDAHPYSGPFTFSLSGDDAALKQRWKLQPSTGEEAGLISLKSLAYGSYLVPLEIEDQQGLSAKETLKVLVCDCQDKDVCREKRAKKPYLGSAAIGILFAALFLFLLLLLALACVCGKKSFAHMPIAEGEGNQTLMKYNQEGGSAAVKDDASLYLIPPSAPTLVDGVKLGAVQKIQSHPSMNYNLSANKSNSMSVSRQVYRESSRSYGQSMNSERARSNGQMYSGWAANRSNTLQGGTWRNQSLSARTNHHISDFLDRRLYTVDGQLEEHTSYKPCEYSYEGQGSKCYSLDELSLSHLGDDLTFLNDLGPRFKALGNITQQAIAEKKIKL